MQHATTKAVSKEGEGVVVAFIDSKLFTLLAGKRKPATSKFGSFFNLLKNSAIPNIEHLKGGESADYTPKTSTEEFLSFHFCLIR